MSYPDASGATDLQYLISIKSCEQGYSIVGGVDRKENCYGTNNYG